MKTYLIMAALTLLNASAEQGRANALWHGPQGDTYASISSLPNWSGTWAMSDSAFQASGKVADSAPYNPSYLLEQHDAEADIGKPNPTKCLPSGMPGIMGVPLGFEFLFTPGRVTILTEEGPMIRRVFTDGRKHLVDPVATYSGDSIGHWEGPVLVVDTVAIRTSSSAFPCLTASTFSLTRSSKTRLHCMDLGITAGPTSGPVLPSWKATIVMMTGTPTASLI
jgi:hypothetical protein